MHEKLSRYKTDPVPCKPTTQRKQRFLHYVLLCKTQLRVNQKLLPKASNDTNYYRATQKEVTYAI